MKEKVKTTVTVELKNKSSLKALQDLEQKQLIKILDERDYESYALRGEGISDEDFRSWIEYAESTPSFTLEEAKEQWIKQKKVLKRNIP